MGLNQRANRANNNLYLVIIACPVFSQVEECDGKQQKTRYLQCEGTLQDILLHFLFLPLDLASLNLPLLIGFPCPKMGETIDLRGKKQLGIFFIARVTTINDQINDQLLCGHF